jgi:NHL repeat
MGRARWVASFALLLTALSAAPGLADSEGPNGEHSFGLPSQVVGEGVDVKSPEPGEPGLTHPGAAEDVPLSQLDREEASELLDAVFAPVLQGLEGPFDELRPEKFLADNVAVIPAGQQPEGDAPAGSGVQGPTLVSSTIPLRVESSSGKEEVIDLSLEEVGGEFRIANPLVEVGLPQDLGEGIELPGTGVSVEVEQTAGERSPSGLDHNAILYPNVAQDTDFAIAPAPTGFETLTQLRSPDAPRSQVLSLDLPTGAALKATEEGGAEVVRNGEAIVGISPPSALDTTGAFVPAQMDVSGESLVLSVSPDESTQFPILVDPLIQSYKWQAGQNQTGIHFSDTSEEEWSPETFGTYYNPPYCTGLSCPPYRPAEAWEAPVGLGVHSSWYDAKKGHHAAWIYTVPRYFKELSNPPTSFISKMTLSGLTQWAGSPYASPYLTAGLWDIVNKNWVSLLSHTGLEGHNLNDTNWVYPFPNPNSNTNVKVGSVGLWALEDTPNGPGNVKVLSATVELAETATDNPGFGSIFPPSQWMHQSAVPVDFTVSDSGLGVYALTASVPLSGQSWKTAYGCTGVGGSACPRTWSRPYGSQPDLKYDPSGLPQGTTMLKVVAEDPLGHASAASVPVKVDHTAPDLNLSGPLTEQGKIGTSASEYALNYSAADGDVTTPSGIATIGSAGTSEGKFQRPQGVTVDGNGNIWVVDRNNYRVQKFDKDGKFVLQFGSQGSTSGKFVDPRAIAVSSNGTVWVTDIASSRIQAFDQNGGFIRQIGKEVFLQPYGIATAPGGMLWVSDPGWNRVFKLNETGGQVSYVKGSPTDPTALVAAKLNYPIGLATDSTGDVWVADTANDRIQKFDANGKFVGQFGVPGTGAGQLDNPLYIAIARSGNLLVTEEFSNRVQAFRPDGTFLRQFGTAGAGSNQFTEVRGIAAINSSNEALVADAGNHRVQRWSHVDLDKQSGAVSMEVKVDGQIVEPKYAPGCSTENCAISKAWTLKAIDYASGQHNVQVTATDGVGLSTTKALTITTAKDTAGPQLTANSSFFMAPEGWLNQETYSYSASASDATYGVTSLALKIDGKVITSKTQGCSSGGCGATIPGSIDMATYEGGAHSAELIATDAGGNTTKKAWTINVDPKGDISTAEAAATLEAVDDTSGSSVVAATDEVLEPGQIEAGDNPGLQVSGSVIESTGTPTSTTMTTDPDDGFTIDSPDGETTITPVVNEGSADIEIVAEVAGVAANTKTEVDSVVRPQYNGVQTFQAIRSDKSPEKFSWFVNLAEGQKLVLVNSDYAMVIYADGSTAFLITAEEAHDATGKTVPTSLEVSGNVLALKVDFHSAQFVYPIVAGQGWETKYEVPIYVEHPEDEFEIKQREEEEKKYEEGNPPEPTEVVKTPFSPKIGDLILKPRVIGPTEYAAPPYPPSGGASTSKIRVFTVEPNKVCGLHCDHWWANVRNPSFIRGFDWAHWEPGTEVHCSTDNAFWFELTIFPSMPPDQGCGFTGPSKVWKGEGKHLTVWGRYRIGALVATEFVEFEKVRYLALQIWVWPNGFQQDYVGDWDCEGSNVPSYYC